MLTQTKRPRGAALASILGLPDDPGQLPSREPWSVNPPLGKPSMPAGRGGALHSIFGGDGFGAPMARIVLPDGSVRGERLPVNMNSRGEKMPLAASGSDAANGIVATPEQQAESERAAARLGQSPDYAAILRDALGERPKMNTLQTIASIAAPVLMSLSGDQAAAIQLASQVGARGREWDERARAADMEAVRWKREDDLKAQERNAPKFLSGGSDQVRYDPATGESTVVYDAPEDWQTYASGLGYEPGSEEYGTAAQDYVLRGSGPSAFEYDKGLAIIRAAKAESLEAARQRNRERLRGMPTYRDQNPPPARPRVRPNGGSGIVTVKTPQEAAKLPKGTRFRGPDGVTRTVP